MNLDLYSNFQIFEFKFSKINFHPTIFYYCFKILYIFFQVIPIMFKSIIIIFLLYFPFFQVTI